MPHDMALPKPPLPRMALKVCRPCQTVTLHYGDHCLPCQRAIVDTVGSFPDHRLVVNGKIVPSKRKD